MNATKVLIKDNGSTRMAKMVVSGYAKNLGSTELVMGEDGPVFVMPSRAAAETLASIINEAGASMSASII